MKKNYPKKAFLARIEGRVQGVGFRYYAKNEAMNLGLVGWVHNNNDGSVEVWAEGPGDKLDLFLKWLNTGPSHARVDALHCDWQEPLGKDKTFSVR